MNRNIILILLSLSLALKVSAEPVKIILNIDDKSITQADLYIDKAWLRINPEKYTAKSTNGTFAFEFNESRNRIAQLQIGQLGLFLYVQPGDSLVMQVSGYGNVSIALSGTAAQENEFFQQFLSKYQSALNDSLNQSLMLSSSIDLFESNLYNLRKSQESFLKESANYASFRMEFVSFMESQITYHYWASLLNYPIARANSSNTILTVDPLPAVMMDGLEGVPVNDESALIADSYRNFLKYYNIYFTSKANGFKKFTDYAISADKKSAMAKDKFTGGVYAYWLARFITDECGRLAPFMVKKLQDQLKTADETNLYLPIVKAYCESLPAVSNVQQTDKTKKSEPKNASGEELDLKDIEGKSVSLSDFKGKTVYIDFWASWCGPCRMMMPFSKKLHEELTEKEKKQIVFLYISIDASKDAWMKGMKDMDIQGANVISPGNWQAKAVKYFQINSIPRYMIMNKKGEIVDFNAKRPADPAILDDLRKYNSQ